MRALSLQEFHRDQHGRFIEIAGAQAVGHYGDWRAEHAALRGAVGVLDLGFRDRLWARGTHRQKFLNGQLTQDVLALRAGEGCYAALIDPKGRMQSDLHLHCLPDAFLLDLEPGRAAPVVSRLQRYILGSDVQLADASAEVGLMSVQGPASADALRAALPGVELPGQPGQSITAAGGVILVHHSRVGTGGYDVFVPTPALAGLADQLVRAAAAVGGGPCGWQALETARIEAGVPRFGADMDETCLPPEAGIEGRAISYSKGCYIGQEVMARLESRGQVARTLRGLRMAADMAQLPVKGDRLLKDGREIGHITSAAGSPVFNAPLALGYVRREVNQPGTELVLRTAGVEIPVRVVLPPDWD